MPEICHRVGVAAPRHRVYEEFATKDDLVDFYWRLAGRRRVVPRTSRRPSDFGAFNEVYASQLPSEIKPVRTTVRADFVSDMRVEVAVIACRAR